MNSNQQSTGSNKFPITSSKAEQVLLAGMGRSGTTWAAEIINYDDRYRVLFEPFLPAEVPEASAFEYLQYLSPSDQNPVLRKQAQRILSGEFRNPWTDRDTAIILENDRILIKDIRCNLMLGWLNRIEPKLKILLIVRHPLQVVDSWRKLGWGTEYEGARGDLEVVLSQQKLLEDFPLIVEIANEIDMQDFVERTVFLWGISYFVPIQQLHGTPAYTLFYEDLVNRPLVATSSLMEFLGRPFCLERLEPVFSRLSKTNFQNRPEGIGRKELTIGWKSQFTPPQISRANEILEMFGLNGLYDNQGNPVTSSCFTVKG